MYKCLYMIESETKKEKKPKEVEDFELVASKINDNYYNSNKS